MARYIDADAFLDKFNKALESQQHYGFYNHAKITQYVMKAIENEPTADVVPKSEVEKFAEEIKLEFYREFDEIIPSIMADKIDDLVKKYTEEK